MKHLFLVLVSVVILTLPATSKASSLMYSDTCVSGGELPYYLSLTPEQESIMYRPYKMGVQSLSCEQVKSMKEALTMVNLALMPAMVALNNPTIKAGLLAQFTRLGATVAASNPAVLAVTVIGASGYAVINIIMKQNMEKCERMGREKLKQEILKELKAHYQFSQNSSLPLNMEH